MVATRIAFLISQIQSVYNLLQILGKMSLVKANYYDSPEGSDLFGKMVATNKYAVAAGLGWSSVEVLMISKPKGVIPTLGRYVYFTGPFIGIASAFTVGAYAANRLRGKDDT